MREKGTDGQAMHLAVEGTFPSYFRIEPHVV